MLKVAHYVRFHTLEVIKLEYKYDFYVFSLLLFFLSCNSGPSLSGDMLFILQVFVVWSFTE
jgi:hypothetical protein